MKALLICPSDRPGTAQLAENAPLAVAPLLGKSPIEYWLDALVARGAKHVIVLAADRPHDVRRVVGDGTRWGVRLDLIPQGRELTVTEARAKFRTSDTGWLGGEDIIVVDHLPGLEAFPLFESYHGWFAALHAFLPRALTSDRIGAHEVRPGIWIGLHAQISPKARLQAPCWIGEHALVADDATIGPGAIIEDRAIIERGAKVAHSVIGPETFVGEWISVQHSIAIGSMLVNWKSGSSLRVPDAFFLSPLSRGVRPTPTTGAIGRALAALAMLVSAPAALAIMLLSLVRGDSPLVLRLGVRPKRNVRSSAMETFAYYELAAGRNWLRRWPQFWNVVRGDLTWVGNRPLRPTQALGLANDFERLWLAAPVGLVSLADAHGCLDQLSDEACAHASYYAVNASLGLDWFVLTRGLYRALAVWPIGSSRRKYAGVGLPQLVPKQEI